MNLSILLKGRWRDSPPIEIISLKTANRWGNVHPLCIVHGWCSRCVMMWDCVSSIRRRDWKEHARLARAMHLRWTAKELVALHRAISHVRLNCADSQGPSLYEELNSFRENLRASIWGNLVCEMNRIHDWTWSLRKTHSNHHYESMCNYRKVRLKWHPFTSLEFLKIFNETVEVYL